MPTTSIPSFFSANSFFIDASGGILSVLVLLLTLTVSTYSIGYIKERRVSYYITLILFSLSMVGFLLSDNLFLLFMFWEGLGITSFVLVRHYRTEKSIFDSNLVLLFNKAGDLGLVLAISTILLGSGSVFLTEATNLSYQDGLHILIQIGLVTAGLAKSSQFLFYIWLNKAMSGPTPVSSLLHSATMVAAGSILFLKFHPLLSTQTLQVIEITCLLTGIIAAWSASFQNDIKNLLAYSTVSNLSLLCILGSKGAVDLFLAFFIAHAFFKCGAFLFAGLLSQTSHSYDFSKLKPQNLFEKFAAIYFAASLAGLPFFGTSVLKDSLSKIISGSDLLIILTYLSVFYGATFLGKLFRGQNNQNCKQSFILALPIAVLLAFSAVTQVWLAANYEVSLSLGSTVTKLGVFALGLLVSLNSKLLDAGYLIESVVLGFIKFLVDAGSVFSKALSSFLEAASFALYDSTKLVGGIYLSLTRLSLSNALILLFVLLFVLLTLIA